MLELLAQIIPNPGLKEVAINDSTLTNALTFAFGILGGISLLIITLQGMRYSLSSGDPGKTKQAKDGIIYALAGIVIALMGASITRFVLTQVLKEDGGSVQLTGSASIFVNAAILISFATGVISVIMIIVAGIKYSLSGGDSGKVNSAKNTIIYALVGVAISAIASPLIIYIVKQVAS